MTLLVKNRLLAFAGKFLIFLSLCCCGNANFAVAQSLSGQTPQQTNKNTNWRQKKDNYLRLVVNNILMAVLMAQNVIALPNKQVVPMWQVPADGGPVLHLKNKFILGNA